MLDFFEREIDYNSLQYLKEETFEALERYEIQERDIFISIAGSIGYAGAFNPQIKDRVILTENAARLVIDDKFRSDYLAFQLNSRIVQDQILKEIGTGGGVPKLALHRIENLKVICPFLNEQMRIVDIFGFPRRPHPSRRAIPRQIQTPEKGPHARSVNRQSSG